MDSNPQIAECLSVVNIPVSKQVNPVEMSFVIIEYHCLDSVHECIDRIESNCAEIVHEIIVSSNSIYDEQKQEIIRKKIQDTKWIFNDYNKGFAGGMNSGILMSSGEVIVLINPDVQISNGDMRKSFNYLMSHENVGIIGPRIVDTEGRIQDSCRKFMDLREFIDRMSERVSRKNNSLLYENFDYTSIQRVDWVIGAFMMVKREALSKVGLLDQHYFLYVEDMDWCNRFWNCGYEVVYYPHIEVIYQGDRKSTSVVTSRRMLNKYSFNHLKSYMRFLYKNKLVVRTKMKNFANVR